MSELMEEQPADVTIERAEDDSPGVKKNEGLFETSNELRTVDKVAAGETALVELPDEEQTRIMRKVDWRILPLLAFLYLISFVDRSNSTYSHLDSVDPLADDVT
jgi:hypothetical protein